MDEHHPHMRACAFNSRSDRSTWSAVLIFIHNLLYSNENSLIDSQAQNWHD